MSASPIPEPPRGSTLWGVPAVSQDQHERLAVIVFVDIVGFSRYLGYKQENLITALNAELSRELFKHLGPAKSDRFLVCLPTGDGVALVFVGGCEDNALFSLLHGLVEWTRGAQERVRLPDRCRIRVGVHAGSVSLITDLNRRLNVCGDDINTCQRIMDQAWPNQVLFSEAAYDRFVRGDHTYSEYPFTAARPARFSPLHRVTAKHDRVIEVRVMYRDPDPGADPGGAAAGEGEDDRVWDYRPPKSAPRVVDGPTAALDRTRRINDLLAALAAGNRERVAVCEQASFSTFSITDGMEPTYERALVQECVRQRERLELLMRKRETTVRVLLRPIPPADGQDPAVALRLRALAAWMDANLDGEVYRPEGGARTASRVQFRMVLADDKEFWQAGGPNVFLVRGHVRIDGYRVRHNVSHGLSLFYYEDDKIREAVTYFDRAFGRAGDQSNHDIRAKLEPFLARPRADGKPRAGAAPAARARRPARG